MKLKEIFFAIAIITALNATTIQTEKPIYLDDENIRVTLSEMLGDNEDWIAIYPKDSSNEWENIVDWAWTEGIEEGNISFDDIPVGHYQLRAFFENSYTVEATCDFNVSNNLPLVALTIDKEDYTDSENITIHFSNMVGDAEDWIGIYPKNSSNAWENVIHWEWTGGKRDGELTFSTLDVGEYEVRAFFRNSFDLEKSLPFLIVHAQPNVELTSSKAVYLPNELIYINFDHMLGASEDWIGIYPAGSSYEFENVVAWKNTGGTEEGELSFEGLPTGEYNIRAFFNNSLTKEAEITISVHNEPVVSTIYEDAEDGLSPNWVHASGNFAPLRANRGFESNGTVVLVTQWTNGGTQNVAEYHLDMNNTTQKVLEMDIGGVYDYLLPNKLPEHVGYMSHFAVGVHVTTLNGTRRMLWDSFLNHGNVNAYSSDYGNGNIWMYYPSPVEHVRGWYEDIHTWQHFKVNIESELRKLEPNNKIVKINYFIATGGFLDNLKLSSH